MPKKMDNSTLKAMLASERADALAAVAASKLSKERADALDYYMGDMTQDMPAPDGRSKAVSTDVADTIEGMMPQLMDIFVSGDEVVRFEPVGPEDVQGAEQETDYVNHVFMQQNPGFLVLYSMIKDALLSKVGIVKVWWETKKVHERETYYNLSDDELAIVASDPDVEMVQHTAKPLTQGDEFEAQEDEQEGAQPALHDVVLERAKDYAQAKIEPVPPEEFGISRNARNLRDCDYAFHRVFTTRGRMIAQGYDEDQIDTLAPYVPITNMEEVNRNTVWEQQYAADKLNQAAIRIEVTEHYIRMDYDGDGNPRLYKVTTGGSQGDILRKDGKDDIEEIDFIPLAGMTPIPMTHRFFGRSVADIVMDIQRIKTALLRGALDNTYLASNPRVVVDVTQATPQTLDDLLISRPGGVVRAKGQGAIEWQTVPNITGTIFPALEYMDATREWRTGVTRQGQGIDSNALQNQSATAVNQAFTAAQARVKLIARIFAETGIRDLFQLLHATIRKHGEEAQVVRLRNNWVNVDPRNWKTRNDMTINVGLGAGSKAERVAHLMTVLSLQKEAMMAGLTNLVGPENLYNSAKELTKLIDLKNTDSFFTDPRNQPAPQAKPDPKLMEIQAKAQAEQAKIQADAAHQTMKAQAEAAMADKQFELDKQRMLLDHELKRQELLTKAVVSRATRPRSDGDISTSPSADHDALDRIMNKVHEMSAPKRIVRDAAGNISHLETIPQG